LLRQVSISMVRSRDSQTGREMLNRCTACGALT
jgi:hypothetical protein